MSHGTIAVEHADGTISMVNVVHGSKLDCLGKLLVSEFETLKRAERIVERGDFF